MCDVYFHEKNYHQNENGSGRVSLVAKNHPDSNLLCIYCREYFSTNEDLKTHIEKKHPVEAEDVVVKVEVDALNLLLYPEEEPQELEIVSEVKCSSSLKNKELEIISEKIVPPFSNDRRFCYECSDDFYWPDAGHVCLLVLN